MSEVGSRTPRSSRAHFTAESLPLAVGSLFEMNNYSVQHDVHIHGAQVDLVVTAKGDPFAVPMYVEATIEHVTNDKYGKDSTKFLLIKNKEPGAKVLCISSTGFTAGVRERAKESGVEALTYEELFAKFEKFTPYVDLVLNDVEFTGLTNSYEEPFFNDSKGIELATPWLTRWRSFAPDEAKWLIVLGEYGTGKTSLTRVLQHRWLSDYHRNPSSPIPIRIELRNFSRQFDANSLLHHFLDSNRLSHVPIEFMSHLIKTGRVVLLLDGYDEMAQFLNARERRACLNTLADLSADGAKGILTSRPNYFTEHEELNVFEALYRTIEQGKYHLSQLDRSFLAKEQSVDQLIERYILNKFERSLQDLSPDQTKSLVKRKLNKDIEGQAIVLGVLDRVFREEAGGSRQSLSGKPVIISYLLDLVSDLKADAKANRSLSLTEWQVYKLIVDKLMLRDLQRTGMDPEQRRAALQRIAFAISGRDRVVAEKSVFDMVIDAEFQRELRTLTPDERRSKRIEIFEDLRSSATLTRAAQVKVDGWVFSHNSLREFLVAEQLLNSLIKRQPVEASVPISAAMRAFTASIGLEDLSLIWRSLADLWPQRVGQYELGPYFCLLWDAARRDPAGAVAVMRQISGSVDDGNEFAFNSVNFREVSFRDEFRGKSMLLNAKDSVFSDCDLSEINLSNSIFEEAIVDSTSLRDCDLSGCNFKSAFLFECDLSGACVTGADFRGLVSDSSILIDNGIGLTSWTGREAVGYLKFNGAVTDDVDDYYVKRNHLKYSIIIKIVEKVVEQKHSQLRGLTQRGGARSDPPFARAFVEKMVAEGWLTVDKNDLVAVTADGRPELQRVVAGGYMPRSVAEFLEANA